MAASQAILIYGTESGILRRLIVPDDDSQISRHQPGPGESLVLLPSNDISLESCQAAVEAIRGIPIEPSRCCVVNAGVVLDAIIADPKLDTVEAGTLVKHAKAGKDDTFVNGVFMREYALVGKSDDKVKEIKPLPLDDPESAIDKNNEYIVPKGNLKPGDKIPKKPPK